MSLSTWKLQGQPDHTRGPGGIHPEPIDLEAAGSTRRCLWPRICRPGAYRLGSCRVNQTGGRSIWRTRWSLSTWKLQGQPDPVVLNVAKQREPIDLEAAGSTRRPSRGDGSLSGAYRLGSCRVNQTQRVQGHRLALSLSTWKLQGQPDTHLKVVQGNPGAYRLGSCRVNQTASMARTAPMASLSTWKLQGQPDRSVSAAEYEAEPIDLEAAGSTRPGQGEGGCGHRAYRLGSCRVNQTAARSTSPLARSLSTWKLQGQPDACRRLAEAGAEPIDLEAAGSTRRTADAAVTADRAYRLGSCRVN